MKTIFHYFRIFIVSIISITAMSAGAQNSECEVTFGRQFDSNHSLRSVIGQIGSKIYIDTYEYEGTLKANVENLADKIRFVVLDTENMGSSSDKIERFPEYNIPSLTFPEFNGKHLDYSGSMVFDQKVLLFFRQSHVVDKMNRFFILPLNADLEISGELMLVFEKPGDRSTGQFSARTVLDELSMELSVNVFYKNEDGLTHLEQLNYSHELKQIGKRKFKYEVDSFDAITDYHVSESGELHLIVSRNEFLASKESLGKSKARAEAKKRGSDMTYRYLRLDSDSRIQEETELGDADHPVTRANFYSVKHNPSKMSSMNGQIFILGEYAKPGFGSVLQGVFSQMIDLVSYQNSAVLYQDIDREIFTNIVNQSGLSGSGFSRMRHFRPCLQEDGTYVCFAEMYRESFENSKLTPGTYEYDYEYDHVMVYAMERNGNLKWSKVIQKLQHTRNDNAICSSIVTLNSDDGIRLFYNDNVENLEALPGQKIKKMNNYNKGKAATVALKIDQTGKMERSILTTDFDKRLILNFNSATEIKQGNQSNLFFLGKVGLLEVTWMPILISPTK